jgi:hypothetical protein
MAESAERATYQSMNQTKADIAGGGFAASGSGLDILASSASQGALQQSVIQQQGLITEAGYERAGAELSQHGERGGHGGLGREEGSDRGGYRGRLPVCCGSGEPLRRRHGRCAIRCASRLQSEPAQQPVLNT